MGKEKKKGKNYGKRTLSSTARAQIAQQGVVRKGACVTTDSSRGQRSMDLRNKFALC